MLTTSAGATDVDVAHGLADSGTAQWIHCVMSWLSGQGMEVYINGVKKGTGTVRTGTVSNAGALVIASYDHSAQMWNGKIDGLRILRRYMGAAEVLTRYNNFA
jgi:hypothetical protein